MDNEAQEKQVCETCDWYYDWFGVCYNGDSEYCADCPPEPEERGCPCWKRKVDKDGDKDGS